MQNLFTKITQKNTNGSINNVICNSAQKGLIPQREYFDKDIANSDNTDGYFVIKKGDFVYNPRKSVTAPYGPVSVYNNANDGIISPLYLCFRPKEAINTAFFEWYFKSSAWHRYVYLYGDSGVRHDRVNIKDSTFFEMPLHIPCDAEQKKLAHFLSLLDSLIHKQQQLVDSLKLYKRGLLSLVFDDKSPTHILEDILQKGKAGGTPQSSNATYYNGDIPFLSIADMTEQGKYIYSTDKHISEAGLQNSTAWIVPNDSLILSMYASYGLVSINKVPLATSQAMFNMIFRQNVNVEYIYYYLTYLATTDYYTKKVSTGTQPNLNAEKVKAIPLYIPSQNEQKHIVEVLQIYDNRLTKEEKILTQLQASKAALLQQLFI